MAALALCTALIVVGCGDDDADPVQAAQERVDAARAAVAEAEEVFDETSVVFCEDGRDYITAVDRYGKVFDDATATVGDVETAGGDLAEPGDTVKSSAEEVVSAADELRHANQELTDAETALAAAQSPTTGPVPTATTITAAPLAPEATVQRVERAESEFADVAAGITDQTPLTEATEQLNSAAFALEVAWLELFVDAGCLTNEQQQEALAAVTDYTSGLQAALNATGYYSGDIDGVYGPLTVEAVERLQMDNGLPVTSLVDRATATALEAAEQEISAVAASEAVAQTAAVQSTLKLAGYWTGPVDGQWTEELTDALIAFQTALGVPATGAVDAATLSALQDTIAAAQATPSPTPTPTTAQAEPTATATESP
jgi:peptidoglycan hydrolase-like protein with peptidoglycan-binding domain